VIVHHTPPPSFTREITPFGRTNQVVMHLLAARDSLGPFLQPSPAHQPAMQPAHLQGTIEEGIVGCYGQSLPLRTSSSHFTACERRNILTATPLLNRQTLINHFVGGKNAFLSFSLWSTEARCLHMDRKLFLSLSLFPSLAFFFEISPLEKGNLSCSRPWRWSLVPWCG
jgi:hypothetical protein